jgi:hypothetical protein
VAGRIVALHPASVEIELTDGTSVHVTNSQVFAELPRTRRHGPEGSIGP